MKKKFQNKAIHGCKGTLTTSWRLWSEHEHQLQTLSLCEGACMTPFASNSHLHHFLFFHRKRAKQIRPQLMKSD